MIAITSFYSSPLRGEVAERSEAGGSVKAFSEAAQRNAKSLRNNLTEAEKRLWYVLRNKQMGVQFRRQQPFGVYVVDFISLDAKLIIELDGGQHAMQPSYDAKRDAYMKNEGFTVLRFWNNDLIDNMEAVLQQISQHLQHPLPTSPLKGEELSVGGV